MIMSKTNYKEQYKSDYDFTIDLLRKHKRNPEFIKKKQNNFTNQT